MTGGIVKRIYWRILRGLGLEQLAWNSQFKAGVWCRGPVSPTTARLAAKLCRGGKLIQFGCGEGDLPAALPAGCYSEFVGIDISDLAIERARKRAQAEGAANRGFSAGDMAQWPGAESISLILLEETLYYLRPLVMEQFLLRCMKSLAPDGSILVIVHSASKHAKTLEICRRVCRVKEEEVVDLRTYLVLGAKEVVRDHLAGTMQSSQ